MNYCFHPAARDEYLDAARFYEGRRSGLGARFTAEVEATIAQILEAPRRWSFIEEDIRRCITHVFPNGILYTIEDDTVLIVAVMHCSRKPGYWRRRIGK